MQLALTNGGPPPFSPAEESKAEQREKKRKEEKEVEAKKARDANESEWKKQYAWLMYSGARTERGDPKGLCTLCCEHSENRSKFAGSHGGEGAVISDKNTLAEHEKSEWHKKAVGKAYAIAGGEGSIEDGFQKMHKKQQAAVSGVLPTMLLAALWLIKEGVPGQKFASLLQLICLTGTTEIAHKYNHRSEVLLCATIALVNASPLFALLCDGGTDISTQNHMMVYLRFLDVSTYAFVTVFLCCVGVKGNDADHHYSVLLGILESLGINKDKLVAICTDGASNYMGVHTGVQQQLREKLCPYIVGVHCSAHRTALVMNDAGKGNQCLETVDSLLKAVHGLFCKSHKRQEEWIAFAQARGIKRFKFPLFVPTRWLSR
eukprot:scaffold87859_cov18-Tisochrysis_lutea.AAC.1